jgi:hypothetical protein
MGYSEHGGYPAEYANKIGHIRLIQDPYIQRVVEAFEDTKPEPQGDPPPGLGHIDFEGTSLAQIITVDGGSAPVPNVLRAERQVGFVQVAAQLLKLETLDYLRTRPMTDPREVNLLIGRHVHHIHAILPLAGLHMPGQTVRESLRELIRRFLSNYDLDQTLRDLVYRVWSNRWPPADGVPHQQCLRQGCDGEVTWSNRFATAEKCAKCGEQHWITDYLGLIEGIGEDRSRTEIVDNFRRVTEALALFTFILRYRDNASIMSRTLFLLDGPLLLRAQLSRLVEPIRDLIASHRQQGKSLYLVGVEKDGDFRMYVSSITALLKWPGDYFLPNVRFLVEQVAGNHFNPNTYRNRVNYGAKVSIRLGGNHTLALNVPTGPFLLDPGLADLIGLEEIAHTLSRVLSSAHENALIPIVLINQQASIAAEPSGSLLHTFVDRLVNGGHL